jgi:spore coat protein A, manganese oxidase
VILQWNTAVVQMVHFRRGFVSLALMAAAAGYAAMPAHATIPALRGMTLGGTPTAPAPLSATIVIGKGAATKGYTTKTVTISQGGTLSVVNEDNIEHTVTSVALGGGGSPLFDHFTEPGSTTSIPAASKLAAGTYTFYCRYHPSVMRGTLIVDASSGGGGTKPVPLHYEQPLRVPPVLTGGHIHVAVKRAQVRVLPHGPKTWMWTYGGTYPGPTIERPVGKDTKVTFTNRLPASAGSITVHLHGDHHTWQNDGQPTRFLIGHNKKRTYDYPLTDSGRPEPAAFDYYHDHRMNLTGRNNWRGLQGMFITHDARERGLRLPGGKHDIPLLISDRSFTKTNQLTNPFAGRDPMMTGGITGPHAPPGDATIGSRILADGRFAPYLNVGTHRYRLRLLNGSDYQSYDFALSDGRPFVQVGSGDDLLPKPVVRQSIVLGPSQRADVVVDFHGELHQRVVLESITAPHSPLVGIGTPTASIMQFRVTHSTTDRSRIPPTLAKPPPIHVPNKISKTWTLGLGGNTTSGTFWTINGRRFDPNVVDTEVPLGSTQAWLLKNNSPMTHYIHLHEEQWHTIKINGKRPPPWERGLDDTWQLNPGETIEVAARFSDYAGVFMIHCHMLDHEDDGLMAQFAVVNPRTHYLPHGYHLVSSRSHAASSAAKRNVMPASMTMPMSSSMQLASVQSSTGDASATQSRLARVISRSGRALGIELAALAIIFGWRRYRRPPTAG